MLFRVNPPAHMWDNWLFHDDKYYLFFLMGLKEGPWNAFGVATSLDAVHWTYVGPIVTQKHPQATWMGTGYTWRSPVPGEKKYFLNFSEWFDSPAHPGQQKIYFCTSDDLIHWRYLPDAIESTPDPLYYRLNEGGLSRWDTIHELKKEGGGLYGYLTANPKDFLHGAGLLESKDGIHWQALPAPKMIWSKSAHMELMNSERGLEIGGIARFGNRIAMIIADSKFSMAIMWAEDPKGPFISQTKNFNLFPTPKGPNKHTPVYYTRFFFAKSGEIFFNVHAIAKGFAHGKEPHPVYTTPLKLAKEDKEGILRAYWWSGNDCLKHSLLPAQLDQPLLMEPWLITPLLPKIDVRKGAVFETSFNRPQSEQSVGIAIQLTNSFDNAPLYEFFTFDQTGKLAIGVMELDDGHMTCDFEDEVDLESPLLPKNRIRILLRLGFVEIYLNDQLIRQWSLALWPSGNIAWVSQDEKKPCDLGLWEMNLPDIDRTGFY